MYGLTIVNRQSLKNKTVVLEGFATIGAHLDFSFSLYGDNDQTAILCMIEHGAFNLYTNAIVRDKWWLSTTFCALSRGHFIAMSGSGTFILPYDRERVRKDLQFYSEINYDNIYSESDWSLRESQFWTT